jgi:hypothetical protein
LVLAAWIWLVWLVRQDHLASIYLFSGAILSHRSCVVPTGPAHYGVRQILKGRRYTE